MNAKLMGLVAVGGLMAGISSASAANLAQYSFTGGVAAGGSSAATSSSNGTAGPYGGGPGVAVQASSATGIQSRGYDQTGWVEGEYTSFSFTPSPNDIDLTQLTFSWDREGSSAATNIDVRAKIGSGALSGSLFTQSKNDTALETEVVNLSSLPNILSGQAVTLYIYGWGQTSSTQDLIIDEVLLEGNVAAIPEPASLGLLGLAGVTLLRRRA